MSEENVDIPWTPISQSEPTIETMHRLWLDGAIGTKEFRSWLAKVNATFADIRDSSIDNNIDEEGRDQYEMKRELRRQEVEAIRGGKVHDSENA